MKISYIGLISFCASIGALAQAQTYNLNLVTPTQGSNPGISIADQAFNSMAPVSPASYTGTTWNNHVTTFGNNAINNLFSADGDASAVSVALTNNGVFSFTGGLDVVANYAFTPSTAAQTMTFSGLTSGSIWDLYIVSQGDQAGQGGTFLLDTTENISAGSAPAASTWTEGGNYVLFSGIEIGGTGEFTIDWSSNGAFGVVNGLQLVAVPEPSTYAMVFGAAVLGFCVIRRRQRK